MTEQALTPSALMPKWWQRAATTLLYAAYLLWLIPIVLYVRGDVSLGGALAWFAGVVVLQFILVKLIALVEYLSTANEIERLNAIEDAQAQSGEQN